jgi:hypothetical protein
MTSFIIRLFRRPLTFRCPLRLTDVDIIKVFHPLLPSKEIKLETFNSFTSPEATYLLIGLLYKP